MEAPQEDRRENGEKSVPQGDIVFDKVSFSYNQKKEILSGLDLVIPKGKMTAITGVSGSGKTTILKLMEQLYLPNEGRSALVAQILKKSIWMHGVRKYPM